MPISPFYVLQLVVIGEKALSSSLREVVFVTKIRWKDTWTAKVWWRRRLVLQSARASWCAESFPSMLKNKPSFQKNREPPWQQQSLTLHFGVSSVTIEVRQEAVAPHVVWPVMRVWKRPGSKSVSRNIGVIWPICSYLSSSHKWRTSALSCYNKCGTAFS